MNLVGLIPLLVFVALVVSFLGSLSGVGGGVLFVPIMLWLLTDNSFSEIKFVSTLLVFASALINVVIEIFQKRFSWILTTLILVVAVPTIFLGNYLSSLINQKVTQIIVIVLLIFVTFLLIFNRFISQQVTKWKTGTSQSEPEAQQPWYLLKTNYGLVINGFKVIFIAFLGGLITTLTGMGGGPILMPLLLLMCGLSINQAAPISHTIIAITALITLCLGYHHFTNQTLNLTISLPMLFGVVGGTILAALCKPKIKNPTIIKWVLIALIWISVIKLILDLIQN